MGNCRECQKFICLAIGFTFLLPWLENHASILPWCSYAVYGAVVLDVAAAATTEPLFKKKKTMKPWS
jgi:hypothetical protein